MLRPRSTLGPHFVPAKTWTGLAALARDETLLGLTSDLLVKTLFRYQEHTKGPGLMDVQHGADHDSSHGTLTGGDLIEGEQHQAAPLSHEEELSHGGGQPTVGFGPNM